MTEAEWLACADPVSLMHVSRERTQNRKVWLFGCACCRQIWKLLIHPASRSAVEVVERYAEGNAERSELDRAAEDARFAFELAQNGGVPFSSMVEPTAHSHAFAALSVYDLAYPALSMSRQWMRGTTEAASCALGRASKSAEQVALVRDIFGNPFRPVTFSPSWRTSTPVALAAQMYESRDFGAMPILADALQDAGCDNADVLGHCRGDSPHVRGCWVVDLVLGKE